MLDPAPEPTRARRVLRWAGFVMLGAGVLAAVSDRDVGWFFILVLMGGALGAGVFIAIGRRPHHAPLAVPDPFAKDTLGSMFNVHRVRVAGVGGIGLVVVAVAMALDIPRIGVSLALGLAGGFLIALALIPYRRRHAGRRP